MRIFVTKYSNMAIETTHGEIVNTAEMKKRFLDAYIENPVIKNACKAIRLERRTFYHWLANDEQFAKEFNIRKNIVITFLEDEAYRRAVSGVSKPVYQGGVKVGEYQEYSDTLLALLLKANAPEKYRDKAISNNNTFNFSEGTIRHVNSNQPLSASEEEVSLDAPMEAEYIDLTPAQSKPMDTADAKLLNSLTELPNPNE